MITNRVYILDSNFDSNINNIYDINNNINLENYKLIKKYQVCKKTYLNINQEINNNNNIQTYCEYYKVIYEKNNKIIVEYKRDILDNLEFPPLNKYDFEEIYEEVEYQIKYGKLITNKYQTYLEIDNNLQNINYDDIFNIF
jgi:hypothetical protein